MEILIVGGGYVGMYTARRLERLLRRSEATVTVVEPRGCMTYQPLLAEAASGSVEPRATGPTTSSTQAKAMKKPRALTEIEVLGSLSGWSRSACLRDLGGWRV